MCFYWFFFFFIKYLLFYCVSSIEFLLVARKSNSNLTLLFWLLIVCVVRQVFFSFVQVEIDLELSQSKLNNIIYMWPSPRWGTLAYNEFTTKWIVVTPYDDYLQETYKLDQISVFGLIDNWSEGIKLSYPSCITNCKINLALTQNWTIML